MQKKRGVPEAEELPAKIVLVILILVIVLGVFSIALTVTSSHPLRQPEQVTGGEVSIQIVPTPDTEQQEEEP